MLSMTVQRNLARSTAELSKSFEQLASGNRINRASDDAAGLAIATSLSKDQCLTRPDQSIFPSAKKFNEQVPVRFYGP